MKIFVVSAGIMLVGLSAYVLGQSGATHLKDITFSPDTRIIADDITYEIARADFLIDQSIGHGGELRRRRT